MTRLARLALLAALGACERARPTDDPTPAPTPAPVPVTIDAGSPPTSCETIVVKLTREGIWIGLPPNVRCIAKDLGGYETELRRLHEALRGCGSPTMELAAETGVPYRDITQVMDLSAKVGRIHIAVSDPAGLSMQFGPPPSTPSSCSSR